jgi:transposase InsO family protein
VDRDPLYTAKWRGTLKAAGVNVVRLPPRSPNLNAYAERFVLSIRRECLNRIVPLGERHLRAVIREYMEHYHRERNHQGLANRLIEPSAGPANNNGRVHRHERLGGLLNFYRRRAA